MKMTFLLLLAVTVTACTDPCQGYLHTCRDDDDCHPVALPRGHCLDDGHVGLVCANYYDDCLPLRFRWDNCAGVNGKKSPLAGYCLRPEYLTDGFLDAGDGGEPPPDMSAASDGP